MKRLLIASWVLVLGLCVGRLGLAGPLLCADENGDTNGDKSRDLSDAVYALAFQFQGGPAPVAFCSPPGPPAPGCAVKNGDTNGDKACDLSDAVYALAFQFQGGLALVPICPTNGVEGICDDNIDNDMDGDTDCADSDCAADPSCPQWSTGWSHTLDEQEPACEVCTDCAFQDEGIPMVGPVMIHNGEVLAETVLPSSFIPGRGDEDWGMDLLYRSQIDFEGCVGNGWNLSYLTDRVQSEAGGVRRYDAGHGRFDLFDGVTKTSRGYFQKYDVNASLETVFRRRDGSTSTYNPFTGGGTSGTINRVADRNGNVLDFSHTATGQLTQAIDSLGRRIDYTYDGTGRLSQISDFDGRITTFQYDGANNLTSITTPPVTGTPNSDDGIAANGPNGNDFPSGKTRNFRYDAANPDPNLRNNLLGITYPNEVATGGPERISFVYGTDPADPLTYDRVLSMSVGGGLATIDPVTGLSVGVPAGGTHTFTYENLAPRVPGDLVTEIRRTTVIDPNGNRTEHYFNSDFHEIRRVEYTDRNVNSKDPASFTTLKTWSADCVLTSITEPEGNQTVFQYDSASPNRFSQGNVLTVTRTPDVARGGDQTQLVTTYTYEPIFNQLRTETSPRGTDPGFVPPLADDATKVTVIDFNLDGDSNDPADGETTRRYRYTTLRTFDYQEKAAADILTLAANQGADLDLDGGGPITALVVATALSLGGGAAVDQNGDGTTGQQRGNVIERRKPNVLLVDGTGQELVMTHTYNQFGQPTSRADEEGNLTTYYYYTEADPDGNGTSEGLVRPGVSTLTGGYLRAEIRDDDSMQAASGVRDLKDLNSMGGVPGGPVQQPVTNSGTSRRTRPASFVEAARGYFYDPVGNLTRECDARGVVTDHVFNQLNQIVETTRASAIIDPFANPAEPVPLVTFAYRERSQYDFNDNLIRRQVEDRGDTSSVGADNTSSGIPFVDFVYRYDLLDHQIEEQKEVSNGLDLVTRYRYDPNGHRVLTIQPEGNAVASFFDDRDLVFQSIRGATSAPPLTLLAPADPTNYDVRGGVPAAIRNCYDGNLNLIEKSDADDTDGSAANNSVLAGSGDRTRFIFDGYDRRTSVVDSVGNQSVVQYDPDGNSVRTSRFGPTGGPSPTSDGPDPLLRPVSAAGSIQSASLVNSNVLESTETLRDEIDRIYQTDRVLFVNTIATVRPPDVQDGASDIGKGDLTPGDNQSIPGVSGVSIIGRVTTRAVYDRNSQPVLKVEDDTDTYSYVYDGADRIVEAIQPITGQAGGTLAGNSVLTAYDDNDNLLETREADVSSNSPEEIFLTTFFHDSLNRLTRRVDNIGQTTDFRYDSRNNLVAVADAQGPVTGASINRRAFGGGALTVNAINDFGNVTRTFYDGINRKLEQERILTAPGDGDGVNIGADIFGVKTATPPADPAQGGGDGLVRILTEWDGNSLLESSTDDNGNQTQYDYDNLNRRVAETKGICVAPTLADRCDPPTTIVNVYDPDDNVVSVTDENGSTITCTFDAINRRTACSISLGTGVVGTTATTNEYDGLSRVTRVTDNNEAADAGDDSTITQAYDSLTRTIEETQQLGALSVRAISCAWRAGRLRPTLIYPNGRVIEARFDALDRLATVADQGALQAIADYEYIGTERVAERAYPINGTRRTHLDNAGVTDVGYDGLRRSVQLRHLRSDNSMVVGFTHDYDRMNNKLSEGKLHDPANDELYAYDSAYRLTDFVRLNAGALTPQYSGWLLDGAGNWKQVDSELRQHSSFNEIIERNDSGVTAVDSDDNGNVTDDGDFLYEWDFKNRLRTVIRKSGGATVGTYSYDGKGRRVRRIVTNSAALDGTTHYYHDDWQVLEESDVLDLLTQQYVYGIYIDEPLVLDQDLDADGIAIGAGDQRLFYHENTLSAVFAITDAAAVILEGYQYESYGLPVVYEPGGNATVDWGGDDVINTGGPSAVGNPYLFTGRRLDPESGWYYYRARYLDPDSGRFTSRDPIGIWEDDANFGNGYTYTGNNPGSYVDEDGEKRRANRKKRKAEKKKEKAEKKEAKAKKKEKKGKKRAAKRKRRKADKKRRKAAEAEWQAESGATSGKSPFFKGRCTVNAVYASGWTVGWELKIGYEFLADNSFIVKVKRAGRIGFSTFEGDKTRMEFSLNSLLSDTRYKVKIYGLQYKDGNQNTYTVCTIKVRTTTQ